jgi:hypothetical protein
MRAISFGVIPPENDAAVIMSPYRALQSYFTYSPPDNVVPLPVVVKSILEARHMVERANVDSGSVFGRASIAAPSI